MEQEHIQAIDAAFANKSAKRDCWCPAARTVIRNGLSRQAQSRAARAVEHGVGRRRRAARCSSSPARARARPTRWRIASRISSMNGADPQRILLLTFSRRAAAEMERRVDAHPAARLCAATGRGARRSIWAGTFHAIGARLLREYAERIGLDRAFTIHDREDSADLMNLVRHELGFSRTREPLSRQGHVPRDLFARRQRRERRSKTCSARHFPGAPNGTTSCASCSPPTSRQSSARTCSITTTCCSTGRR